MYHLVSSVKTGKVPLPAQAVEKTLRGRTSEEGTLVMNTPRKERCLRRRVVIALQKNPPPFPRGARTQLGVRKEPGTIPSAYKKLGGATKKRKEKYMIRNTASLGNRLLRRDQAGLNFYPKKRNPSQTSSHARKSNLLKKWDIEGHCINKDDFGEKRKRLKEIYREKTRLKIPWENGLAPRSQSGFQVITLR